VLAELGLDEDERKRRILDVMNKADLLAANDHGGEAGMEACMVEAKAPIGDDGDAQVLIADDARHVSALTGEGLDGVLSAIAERLDQDQRSASVKVGPKDGAARAWLHERGRVELRSLAESGDETFDVSMDEADWARFRARWPALGDAAHD